MWCDFYPNHEENFEISCLAACSSPFLALRPLSPSQALDLSMLSLSLSFPGLPLPSCSFPLSQSQSLCLLSFTLSPSFPLWCVSLLLHASQLKPQDAHACAAPMMQDRPRSGTKLHHPTHCSLRATTMVCMPCHAVPLAHLALRAGKKLHVLLCSLCMRSNFA